VTLASLRRQTTLMLQESRSSSTPASAQHRFRRRRDAREGPPGRAARGRPSRLSSICLTGTTRSWRDGQYAPGGHVSGLALARALLRETTDRDPRRAHQFARPGDRGRSCGRNVEALLRGKTAIIIGSQAQHGAHGGPHRGARWRLYTRTGLDPLSSSRAAGRTPRSGSDTARARTWTSTEQMAGTR